MTCEHCSGTGTCSKLSCQRCNADRLCSVCQGFGEIGVAAEPASPLHDGVRLPEKPDRKIEKVLGMPQFASLNAKILVFLAFLVAILAGAFASGVAAGWATPPVPKPNYLATALRHAPSAHLVLQKLKVPAEA